MSNQVYDAAPGTLLECIIEVHQPGEIRIYKRQKVLKKQNFDSGKICIEALHNSRLAVVNPDRFRVLPTAPEPVILTRKWKTNLPEIL
jgi:hypothetical protein